MVSSTNNTEPLALSASVSDHLLIVSLSDGRMLSVPITWYPRLVNGSAAERNDWRLIGGGRGIHWPALDEDISVESRASQESAESLQRWLAGRQTVAKA